MTPQIEIVGRASELEAAAIVAAIQAVIAEEEANMRRAHSGSRWRADIAVFQPGIWGVARPRQADEDT